MPKNEILLVHHEEKIGDATVFKVVEGRVDSMHRVTAVQCNCEGYHFRSTCRHVEAVTSTASPIERRGDPTSRAEIINVAHVVMDVVGGCFHKISMDVPPTEDFLTLVHLIGERPSFPWTRLVAKPKSPGPVVVIDCR